MKHICSASPEALCGILCLLLAGSCNGGAAERAWPAAATVPAASTELSLASPAQPELSLDPVVDASLKLPQPSAFAGGSNHNTEPAGETRAVSYTPADVVKTGQEKSGLLPSALTVNGSGTALQFFADFTAPAADMSGLAYAGYFFTAAGYDRLPEVRLAWQAADLDQGDVWIGLSNWPHDRWQWFQADQDWRVKPANFAQYFNAQGELLVMVVVATTDSPQLISIRLGGLPPVASFSLDPDSGAPPLEVLLSANVSDPGEGPVTKFEWDFEGDGGYDINSGLTPEQIVQYPTEGLFHPAVRITNSAGEDTVLSRELHVVSFWQHVVGRADYDTALAADVDASGNIYVVGDSDEPGPAVRSSILLIKFSPLGELLWSRRYSAEEEAHAFGLDVDANGATYVAGNVSIEGTQRPLVLKWDSDGALLWHKTVTLPAGGSLADVQIGDLGVYACGYASGLDSDVLALKFDTDGSLLWLRTRDGGDDDYAAALSVVYPLLFGNDLGISVIGSRGSATVPNVWRLDWEDNGDFVRGLTFAETINSKRGLAIRHVYNFIEGEVRYYVGGTVFLDGGNNLFYVEMPSSGASIVGAHYSGPDFFGLGDIVFDNSGNVLLGGQHDAGSDRGYVLSIDPATAAIDGHVELKEGSEWTDVGGTLPYENGFLAWGQAPSNAAAWSPLNISSDPYSATWAAEDGSGAAPALSAENGPGAAFDTADAVEVDSAAGFHDMYVSYRADL